MGLILWHIIFIVAPTDFLSLPFAADGGKATWNFQREYK